MGQHVDDTLKTATCPIVMDDHRDAAIIPWNVRKWLQHPNVKILMKGGHYRPATINNDPVVENTYHGRLIYNSNPDAFPSIKPELFSVPTLSDADLSKVRIVHHFEQMSRLDPLVAGPLDPQHRHFDVHFIGLSSHKRETIAYHRRQAYGAIEKLTQKNKSLGNKKLAFGPYCEVLRQSKIVVSPWGLGERCHRDYEAILAGCVLLKPDTSWCRTATGIFGPECYRPCKIDFSDLQEQVDAILDEWGEPLTVRREMLRNDMIYDHKPEVAARRVANCIKEAVGAS